MKYYTNGKKLRGTKEKLTALERSILTKCSGIGMNIVRVLKAGKPFLNERGSRQFATTDEILKAVERLVKLELLERR